MALESLLTSLKNDVTHVTAVQPSNHKASGCNGTAPAGVTSVTTRAARADSATAVTCEVSQTLQRKPAPIKACTAVTPVTSEKAKAKAKAKAESEAQEVSFGDTATAPPAKVSTGDTATASRWWLIYYPDRDPVEVACYPEATHAEILEKYPDAVAAEPFTQTIRQPSAPLTADEETAIRAWLALIEETDPATIAEVIGQCQRDADARDYFTGRAAVELPKPDPSPDDRRRCTQCLNLASNGRCLAAAWRDIIASRTYAPVPDLLRRCEGFKPLASDPDQRPGRDRWPGL